MGFCPLIWTWMWLKCREFTPFKKQSQSQKEALNTGPAQSASLSPWFCVSQLWLVATKSQVQRWLLLPQSPLSRAWSHPPSAGLPGSIPPSSPCSTDSSCSVPSLGNGRQVLLFSKQTSTSFLETLKRAPGFSLCWRKQSPPE